MIKKILSIKGNSHMLTISICLLILLILFSSFEFLRVSLIARGARDLFQSSLFKVSAINAAESFYDLREKEFTKNYDVALIKSEVQKEIEQTYSLKDFTISNITISPKQEKIAGENGKRIIITGTMQIKIPFSGIFSKISPINRSVRAYSSVSSKF